jgi:hypothetical protein
MELTSEYFQLASELMEYIPRGSGMYSVDEFETKSKLMSVTVEVARDDNKEMIMSHRENEPVQFYVDVHFVKSDESRGTLNVCFAPSTVMLMKYKKVKFDNLAESLANIKSEIESEGPTIDANNTVMWSKCLMNYLEKGVGVHKPNFVDSMLGMSEVVVKWSQDRLNHILFEFGDGEALIYQCQIAYSAGVQADDVQEIMSPEEIIKAKSEETTGSIIFQAMPYEINFSS